MKKHTCCYITKNGRCGNLAKYRIVKDDDRRPVRKYSSFCPVHEAIPEKDNWEENTDDTPKRI